MALKQDGMHFVLCSKQGNTIEGVVLNRVCGLGIFCPKRDQGFKPLAVLIYTQNLPSRRLYGTLTLHINFTARF